MRNMKNNIAVGIVIVAIIAVAASFIIATPATEANPASSNILVTGADTTADNTEGIGQPVKEFTLNAARWNYTPDTVTVKKGDRVKININNIDTTHGINIPDLGIEGNESVEFTADKSGTFPFWCDKYCGKGHSEMGGKLVVTE